MNVSRHDMPGMLVGSEDCAALRTAAMNFSSLERLDEGAEASSDGAR